jgi:hypothetical protein
MCFLPSDAQLSSATQVDLASNIDSPQQHARSHACMLLFLLLFLLLPALQASHEDQV